MKTIHIILISTPIAMLIAGGVCLLAGIACCYEGWYGLRLLLNPLAW